MGLEINLYHEELESNEQWKRDPLKIGILFLLFVGIVLAAFYFSTARHIAQLREQRIALQLEYDRLSSQETEALKKQKNFRAEIELHEKIAAITEGRLHWAPVLEVVVKAMPKNVQLTRLACTDLTGKKQGYVLILSGVIAGKEPRIAAEDLRSALLKQLGEFHAENAAFQTLEDSSQTALIDGQTLPVVDFTIRAELARPKPVEPTASIKEKKG